MEEKDNQEVIEITSGDEEIKPEVLEEKKVNKKKKFSFKDLSKKKRIILIVVASLIFLILVGLLGYFLFKKDKQEPLPDVILLKDNYRYENGTLILLDENDIDLGSYECVNKNENNCYVGYYSKDERLLTKEATYEDGTSILKRSIIYHSRYVFIFDSTKTSDSLILYDIKNKENLGVYASIKEYSNDEVIAKKISGDYGVITFTDDSFKESDDFDYNYLGLIADQNTLSFVKNSYYGVIGNDKINDLKLNNFVDNYNDNYIVLFGTRGYYLIDYEENELLNGNGYEYIGFRGNYLVLAIGNNLYIRNGDLEKINEDGLVLDNDAYLPVTIYDKDNTKIEVKQAFALTENKDNLSVDYNNTNKVFSLYESELNSSYKYVNYLDGKIYIYIDETKNSLIGSYTCTNVNKNNFDNCYIAKETKLLNRYDTGDGEGYIPVYNHRYVFINDKENLSTNNNIVIWDLVSKSKVTSYAAVDVGYYAGDNDHHLAETTDLMIMARNTSGKYGIVKMGKDSFSKIISFENDSISYLQQYFLVLKDGNYNLYNSKGEKVTKTDLSSQIVKVYSNYLVVKNGNYYDMYSFEGKVINSSKEEICLGIPNYYYAFANNKLELYSLGSSTNLLKSELDVGSATCDDIDIEVTSSGYYIDISDTEATTNYHFDREGVLDSGLEG